MNDQIKKGMYKHTNGEEVCREDSGKEVWYLSGTLKKFLNNVTEKKEKNRDKDKEGGRSY